MALPAANLLSTAAVVTSAVQSQAVENDLLDYDQSCLKIDPERNARPKRGYSALRTLPSPSRRDSEDLLGIGGARPTPPMVAAYSALKQ